MNTDKKVRRYANDLYTDNKDMLAVYDAQCDELSKLEIQLNNAFNNNYVKSSNMQGVEQWEDIFNILHDSSISIDNRKTVIINKLLQQPPFTKIWLAQYLARIFGEDMCIIVISYNDRDLYLAIETNDTNLLNDTMKDIRKLIPANMTLRKIQLEKYLHWYLKKNYTHKELRQFTYGELSKYAKRNIMNISAKNIWRTGGIKNA